jgi:hypothetical protein
MQTRLDYESRLPPSDADVTRHDVWLLAGFCLYAVMNFVAVRATISDAIFPPWNLLFFFSFIGPFMGIVAVPGIHFLSGRRLFRGRWVTCVILGLLVAGCVNYRILWDFIGRRVDLLGRSLQVAKDNDPVNTLRSYLAKSRTASARFLRSKAIVLIDPLRLRGTIVWPVERSC